MIPILGGTVGRTLGEQFSDDFNYTVGVGLPAGFTSRGANGTDTYLIENAAIAGSISGKDLAFEVSGGARRMISLDAIGSSEADVELVMQLYIQVTPGLGSTGSGLWVRYGGSVGSEDGYAAVIEYDGGSGNSQLKLKRYDGGTVADLAFATISSGAPATDLRYYLRMRAIGDTIKAKLWQAGGGEPGAWDIEENESTISAAGWNGFYHFSGSWDTRFAWIGVGTKGAIAPLPS